MSQWDLGRVASSASQPSSLPPIFTHPRPQPWTHSLSTWGRVYGAPALRPGAIAQSPGREAALARASPAKRFPASSVLARAGAGCGSAGDVTGAWLASAPLWPSLWT